MTHEICSRLEHDVPGIKNAYSFPTGIRNEGPEGYTIYYDAERIESSGVEEELFNAVTTLVGPGIHLEASLKGPDSPHRANEAIADENESLPMVSATYVQHPAASALVALFEDDLDDALECWSIEWDPTTAAAEWSDIRFLTEHPVGGLSVFIEAGDPAQYDAIVDHIGSVAAEAAGTLGSVSVEVPEADSDGYHVVVTIDQ